MSDEQPLTVRQLIEMLRDCDPDAPVMIEGEDYYSAPLTENDVKPSGNSVHRYGPYRAKWRGNWIEGPLFPGGIAVYADGETPHQGLPLLDSRPCVVIKR